MGWKEAREDGIEIVDKGRRLMYKIPCHKCGEPVQSYSYVRGRTYTCQMCKRHEKDVISQDRLLEKMVKLQRALSWLEVNAEGTDYSKAAKVIEKHIDREPCFFSSGDEILAGLELLRQGVRIIPQQKVGSYRIDFAIPKEKIALEIDGTIYHGAERREQEARKDLAIAKGLGLDWVVVRVDTEVMKKDITKLWPAVLQIAEVKRM